jgi:hypothetical protein
MSENRDGMREKRENAETIPKCNCGFAQISIAAWSIAVLRESITIEISELYN